MGTRWALLICCGVAACASPQQQASERDGLLAAAGFVARPANTPERVAMLRTLPPNQLVQRARGDQFVYLDADPLACGCVYFGDAAAYGRFQQILVQRRIAQDQVMAAQINADAAWEWGPWGPGWW